ncbi:exopolysaccharide biosynthesis protein [Luteimonas sp. MJ246]|uniref:exopolysaccharide biosynthesis protein n=1 Tax=Luteimonas sp. MJ174 TaxID=3129237 RepID=UPI0031BA7BAD
MAESDPPRATARAVLAALAAGPADDVVTLRSVTEGLGGSLFGMLLFIATLPAFLPIPGVAGALSGPLVSLIGVQLLLCMRRPWLPRMVADRGPRRGTLARFEQRISPWLKRLERVVRPRLPGMIDHPAATAVTGLLLVLLGVLLALPIPFTNYVFGVLLLAYALALLERDGALMLVAWGAGLAAIAFFGITGGTLAALAGEWVDRLL